MKTDRTVSEVRTRLIETADRLFYTEGIHAVGVDRVVAEAGVAKMSLYKHFPSKNDLTLAVLQYREQEASVFFTTAIARHSRRIDDPLKAFFAALKDWFETPNFRGCAFINAAVETADPQHPAFAYARGYKQRFGDFLRGVIERSVGGSATVQVPAIGLLVEGAIVTAAMQGNSAPADVAQEAAQSLISGYRPRKATQ